MGSRKTHRKRPGSPFHLARAYTRTSAGSSTLPYPRIHPGQVFERLPVRRSARPDQERRSPPLEFRAFLRRTESIGLYIVPNVVNQIGRVGKCYSLPEKGNEMRIFLLSLVSEMSKLRHRIFPVGIGRVIQAVIAIRISQTDFGSCWKRLSSRPARWTLWRGTR